MPGTDIINRIVERTEEGDQNVIEEKMLELVSTPEGEQAVRLSDDPSNGGFGRVLALPMRLLSDDSTLEAGIHNLGIPQLTMFLRAQNITPLENPQDCKFVTLPSLR